MSSNDKTRDKLMESMRKTKSGTNKDIGVAKLEEKNKQSKATSNNNKNVSTKKTATNMMKQTDVDSYQSRRHHVWPD